MFYSELKINLTIALKWEFRVSIAKGLNGNIPVTLMSLLFNEYDLKIFC